MKRAHCVMVSICSCLKARRGTPCGRVRLALDSVRRAGEHIGTEEALREALIVECANRRPIQRIKTIPSSR